MKFRLSMTLLLLAASVGHSAQSLSQFLQKPKLVVVLVIDQFRSDYLTRFESRLLPPSKGSELGGFKYLMANGAYYPNAHYNIFQAMTCPGHSMIMTGAYPSENGITMNEWYDRESGKMLYCVKDDEFGVSPRRLKTTTVSDEWKNIDKKGKVVALALKDRGSVMLGGQRADQVLWMNEKNLSWTTSKYYGALPSWAQDENLKLAALKSKSYKWSSLNRDIPFSDIRVFASPFGIETSMDLALAALDAEKLGQNKDQTDFLLLSFSSHDFAGHAFGPNSPEIEDMTLFEDRQFSRLFNAIKKKVGIDATLFFLTADHGIPPAVQYSKNHKIKAEQMDYLALFRKIYSQLDKKYGAPKQGVWFSGFKYFNFYLNPEVLKEKKLEMAEVAQEVKKLMLKEEGIAAVYTRDDLLSGRIAPGYWTEALVNQFVFGANGDVIFIPDPFYYELNDTVVTHLTGYNYDTRVPLIMVGYPFKKGVYAEYARVVDLAPTLSHVLNLVPPPKARGRVLSEALK